MIDLKLATETDLLTIAKLANEIWNQYYIAIIGKAQVDYMLDKMYNQQSLLEQLVIKKHFFYVVNLNNQPIGFVSVSSENGDDFFIHKFYLNQTNANKGIGTNVLNRVISLIKPLKLTLTVNRQNYKSINFYFKNGFKIKTVEDFDIGDGYVMNDFVMEKQVSQL